MHFLRVAMVGVGGVPPKSIPILPEGFGSYLSAASRCAPCQPAPMKAHVLMA